MSRWRLLEINSNLRLARFLCIQIEGMKPTHDHDWRRLEPLAKEEGFDSMPPNGIGNKHGKWREGPLP